MATVKDFMNAIHTAEASLAALHEMASDAINEPHAPVCAVYMDIKRESMIASVTALKEKLEESLEAVKAMEAMERLEKAEQTNGKGTWRSCLGKAHPVHVADAIRRDHPTIDQISAHLIANVMANQHKADKVCILWV